MSEEAKKNIFNLIIKNWKPGLTVALVSIPMSVSIAVASGASPIAGIITAIWAGILASIFGGSNYNIVGSAGALTGILASFVFTNGAELLPMLAIITGVFVLIAYFLKLEKYLVFIPSSVVHGFTLGVGFILALSQLNFAFGLENVPKHKEFIENVIASISMTGQTHLPTLGVFIVFLAGMFILARRIKAIPSAIILTPIGIFLGYLSVKGMLPFGVETLGERFGAIQAQVVNLGKMHISTDLVKAALTVTIVAILETMLCGKVADSMTGTRFNKSKEMRALGIANIGSGLFGGLPATAVLARTSLNIRSGATNKISQGVNSIFVLIISIIFLSGFSYLPLAVVAAILCFTAVRMIEVHHFKQMWQYDKKNFLVAMVAGFFTVYIDPVIGILVATSLALLMFAESISRGLFEIRANDKKGVLLTTITDTKTPILPVETSTVVYTFKGTLNYVSGESHLKRLQTIRNSYKVIIIRMKELTRLDIDGALILNEILQELRVENKIVYVTGVSPHIRESLKLSKEYFMLEEKGLVKEKTQETLKALSTSGVSTG